MAFLDNSGDIILDLVLTDTGRYRLAKGDGSFKIVKFAVGDDEINYSQFNKTHPSGSAYFDLDILSTPILEAFTNNVATMQSKLISIPRNNLLYLPVLKLNDLPVGHERHAIGAFVLAVDQTSELQIANKGGSSTSANAIGVLFGQNPNGSAAGDSGGGTIRVDQGLDTTDIPPSFIIDADLVETQYIVEIDNRFASVCDVNGNLARVSFIDDDNVASYYFSLGTDPLFVKENLQREAKTESEAVRGPRGTFIKFKLKSSIELATSDFLFNQLGGTTTISSPAVNIRYIDTTVKVTGATTGASVSLPLRLAKYYT